MNQAAGGASIGGDADLPSLPAALRAALDAQAVVPADWPEAQLKRLQRLVELRAAHDATLNDHGRRLLQQAIFSTYVDLRDTGAEDDAQSILTQSMLDAAALDPEAALSR